MTAPTYSMNDYQGMLITIEGIDGAGKSTQIKYLQSYFDFDGVLKEPTKSWLGDTVYSGLQDDSLPAVADLFLFLADRVHNVENNVKPVLEDGGMVLCDRYMHSTMAYQSHRVGPDLLDFADDDEMATLYGKDQIELFHNGWSIEPDLVLYLDISVDTSMERCEQGDKYEKRENIEQVRENYETLEDENPVFERIDAEQPPALVADDCYETILEYI